MLSLLGFPGTFGFVGKWAILSAVVEVKQVVLAVILVVTTLLSAGYYLPVIMSAYMREPGGADSHEGAGLPRPAVVTVALAVVVVILVGILPASALASAMDTAGSLGAAGSAPVFGIGR